MLVTSMKRISGFVPWATSSKSSLKRYLIMTSFFAGFPCQPFSIIGNRECLADARGNLVWEAVRILERKQPKAFVLENVKQLATNEGGETIQKIHEALLDAGYRTDYKVLIALNHGLSQKRERAIIIGFNDDSLDCFIWPKPKKSYSPLKDILEHDLPVRNFVSDRIRKSRHDQDHAINLA